MLVIQGDTLARWCVGMHVCIYCMCVYTHSVIPMMRTEHKAFRQCVIANSRRGSEDGCHVQAVGIFSEIDNGFKGAASSRPQRYASGVVRYQSLPGQPCPTRKCAKPKRS